MTLLEVTRVLIGENTLELEWLAAAKAFGEALAACTEPREIRAALHLDSAYLLPLDLAEAAYEKLITLGDLSEDVLKGYAARVLMAERSAAAGFWPRHDQ